MVGRLNRWALLPIRTAGKEEKGGGTPRRKSKTTEGGAGQLQATVARAGKGDGEGE